MIALRDTMRRSARRPGVAIAKKAAVEAANLAAVHPRIVHVSREITAYLLRFSF